MLTLTAPGDTPHLDPRTRQPCPCTPEAGVQLGIWNASLPMRWNRFIQALRRIHGFNFSYFRAIETQHRGALHEHILLVAPDPSRRLILNPNRIRALAIQHGYGHALQLSKINSIGGTGGYVAKYVAKAADQRATIPWINPVTGEITRARYRTWTASRTWGQTMAHILQTQARWARAHARAALDLNTKSYTDTTIAMTRDAFTAAATGRLFDARNGP